MKKIIFIAILFSGCFSFAQSNWGYAKGVDNYSLRKAQCEFFNLRDILKTSKVLQIGTNEFYIHDGTLDYKLLMFRSFEACESHRIKNKKFRQESACPAPIDGLIPRRR